MFAFKHKSLIMTAPPQPGIFNRKLPPTRPISMITFFNLLSFPALAGCLSAIFFLFSCQRSTEPLIIPAALQLEAEGVTCTEVWLRLKGEDEYYGKTLQLYRSDSLFMERKWTRKDTLLLDEDLEPSTNYSYVAKIVDDKNLLGQSAVISITTMDTTSHDFQWKVFTFGNGGSSYLKDAAIINPDDIWCVGKINASGGPYNAAHWDGERWELRRILFKYFCDQPGTFPAPAKSVLALDHDEVFITSGSQIAHWNGIKQDGLDCIPISVNKLWGTNKNNIYAVGVLGAIAHYNGVSWRRIESSTNLGLTDIWGGANNEIYTVGLNYGQALGVVLKYDGIACQKLIEGFVEGNGFNPSKLFKTQLYGLTEGVWLDENGTIYTAGNYLYRYKQRKWDYVRSLPENFLGGDPGNTYRAYLHAVRGNASNDIFIFGESETLIHFNGLTWERLGPPYLPWSYNFWYNGDVKGNLAVGVGKTAGAARIIKLWR